MFQEIDEFINWVRMRSPAAKTWRDYKGDLNLFLMIIGNRSLQEIRPQDVDRLVSHQIEQGFKSSTINRRLSTVVSFYRYLISKGRVETCPVIPKRHYLREPQRLPRPVNEQDLRKFFGSVDDVRDRAMFTLMLRCGLRIGEVASMKMKDLYLGELPSRLIIHGKGSQERTVYLSREAERILQDWLAQRSASTKDEHVFISYQLAKLSTTGIGNRIKRVCWISGVDLTAHRLRHTFADHLLSAGMPITSIQKLMGHRFVETTQNYAETNDKQVQADFYKACEKLDGWKIVMGTSQIVSPDIYGQNNDGHRNEHDSSQRNTIFPDRMAHLSVDLLRQLEAFRQLKANRWRVERLTANSNSFYSIQGKMWDFFEEQCGVKTATDLHLDHVLQLIKSQLDAGYMASSINVNLSSLRSFLSFLKDEDVKIHPSLDHIQRLKETEHLPRYMSTEQILRLKNEMEVEVGEAETLEKKSDALLMRAVFYLLWQAGLRSGEVGLLRFSDFYISSASQENRLFVQDSKWRKGRTIYLSEAALNALKDYFALRGVEQAGDFVFVRNGLPLGKSFLSQRLKRIGKQVDVSVSPHRLRHTFATQLLNVGCRITSIQKLMGHTSLDTTMIYARAFDQTVMLDYFQAVDTIESQPDGTWYALNENVIPE